MPKTINSTPTIRQRFLATYEAAFAGELDEWHSTREYLPALIILLISAEEVPSDNFCSCCGSADGVAERIAAKEYLLPRAEPVSLRKVTPSPWRKS
jgi:uncharacterized protein (DUF924 family)